MSDKPYFEETWFELLFIGGCLGSGYLLFNTLMPPAVLDDAAIQGISMAKLMAEGRIWQAFTDFNLPPLHPTLMALVAHLERSTDLSRLVTAFQGLNLCLYLLSFGLVHWFTRRHIRKPYSFIISLLYVLAPGTLAMAWRLDAAMTYMVLSMASVLVIDWSLSKDSAEGGEITRWELIMICVSIALAMLTQPMGAMLLIAFSFIMIKRFGLKRSALVVAIMLVCMSPFLARDAIATLHRPQTVVAPSAEIVEDARHKGVFKVLQANIDRLVFAVTHNAVGDLNLASLGSGSSHSASSHIGLTAQPWGRWLLGGLAIIGTLYGLYQYTGVGSLYLSAYIITAIVLLPGSSRSAQGIDLAPVLPMLLFYLYFGVMRLGQWMKRLHLPVSRIIGPVLTLWILLCTLSTHVAHWRGFSATASANGLASDTHSPKIIRMSTAKAPETRLDEAQTKSAHRRAMAWLEAHTPENSRVAIPRPQAASLLAQDEAGGGNDVTRGKLQRALKGYDYLVEEAADPIRSIRRKPGQFDDRGLQLVYEDLPGKIRIWQVSQQ